MNEIKWDAPEFVYHEKSKLWFTGSIVLAALLIAAGASQRNILFIAFVVIAEILVLFWGNEPPRTVRFLLSSKELAIGEEKTYALSDIAEFSVDAREDEAQVRCFLRLKKTIRPMVVLLVPAAEIDNVRIVFSHAGIHEKEWEPSLADSFESFMRF